MKEVEKLGKRVAAASFAIHVVTSDEKLDQFRVYTVLYGQPVLEEICDAGYLIASRFLVSSGLVQKRLYVRGRGGPPIEHVV